MKITNYELRIMKDTIIKNRTHSKSPFGGFRGLLGLLLLIFLPLYTTAQINWPQGQLLPSFPAPAQTQDFINLHGKPAEDHYLFTSLKGLVNRTQPRIFSYDGDALAEGPYSWLNSLGIAYNVVNNPWDLLLKYRTEIDGLIIYNPSQIHTVNLATSLAKKHNSLIVSPDYATTLQAAPYNYPVALDLRDISGLTSVTNIYTYLRDNYWNTEVDKRILIGLNPTNHAGGLREYAVALGAAVVWLDPYYLLLTTAESNLLNTFLSSMPPGANYLGWWPEEQAGVTRVSNYGMTTIASDYSTNLPFHSGMPRLIDHRPMPAKPKLENKIYIAFIYSDGDNLQYVEHLMRKLWNNADRGKVPIGWTISSSMVDAMPGALNYYHQSATDNDNLICGPSGYGYTYPNRWTTRNLREPFEDYVARMEQYNVAAGVRVVTVWNTIHGNINTVRGNDYAANAPTLLGITTQGGNGTLTIYNSGGNKLPGKRMTEDYCNHIPEVNGAITKGSNGWNGNEPRFLIVQCNPWNDMKPSDFVTVVNGLDKNKYAVVRPDHIFQLMREYEGLPVNPGAIKGEGKGLTGRYYNGENFETKIAERIDSIVDFNWGSGTPMEDMDAAGFTVRWKGRIIPPFTGHYTFYATCNGVRLWVNDQLIIDKLQGQRNPTTYTGKIYSLTGGKKYTITLEYLKKTGDAQCTLEWASAFLPREVVPQSQLYAVEFEPVINIVDLPNTTIVGEPLALTGTVVPDDADCQTIIWEVKDAGTTGATIEGNILNTTAAGIAELTATIENGKAFEIPYTLDFSIEVHEKSGINNLPIADIKVYPNPTRGQLSIVNCPLSIDN